jgi:hypothetical protein
LREHHHGTGNLERRDQFRAGTYTCGAGLGDIFAGVDFDWLDSRSMEPVGYKRVNKVTGKEVTKEHIVKGVAYEKGRYVVLSEEEIRSAHPLSTQTIDIFPLSTANRFRCKH